MSNWIMPEKVASPIVNLDFVWGILKYADGTEFIIEFHTPTNGPHEQMKIQWRYDDEKDLHRDYLRLLKRLGLVNE